MEFEWDYNKELENIEKHSINFFQAQETFYDPKGIKLRDIKHSSEHEERFYWVGKDKNGKILTTRFTIRGDKIRIIGCAEWRKFRRFYERT